MVKSLLKISYAQIQYRSVYLLWTFFKSEVSTICGSRWKYLPNKTFFPS